jgi:hypothetical protein
MFIHEKGGMLLRAPVDSKVYLHTNLLSVKRWRPAEWIVLVFLLRRSRRDTFLTKERISLEDDPHVALAALARNGLSLQASQFRRGRLGEDWHPFTLSTPFYLACKEYKLTGRWIVRIPGGKAGL